MIIYWIQYTEEISGRIKKDSFVPHFDGKEGEEEAIDHAIATSEVQKCDVVLYREDDSIVMYVDYKNKR